MQHFTSYTESFNGFVHQSGKFRVENTVIKSTKMHQIALKNRRLGAPARPRDPKDSWKL
jgi:hypothetical protein